MTQERFQPSTEPLTAAQRAKIAARLSLRPNREERGESLPATQAALALPSATLKEQANRAAALAAALLTERLVVPVGGQAPLPQVQGSFGGAVLAFTSAAELSAWSHDARPAAMAAQQVAALAGQVGGAASIVVDAGSENPVVLPIGAVHALAGGDLWQGPWEDPGLRSTLTETARAKCAEVVGVSVLPAASSEGPWEGALEVRLFFEPAPATGTQRAELANAIAAVRTHPRLAQCAPAITLTPIPIAAA